MAPLRFVVELYGSVAPENSRLLRVLSDGFPIFEPTDLLVTGTAAVGFEDPEIKALHEPTAAEEMLLRYFRGRNGGRWRRANAEGEPRRRRHT